MHSPLRFVLPPLRLLFMLSFAALSAATTTNAAEPGKYIPKGDFYSIQAHLAWCGEAKTSAERLKRYESFWQLQYSDNLENYDDDLHLRSVRRCAYRLAQLYLETGRRKDCLRMLKTLEKEDARFDAERSAE